jgi:hypothetical protein
MIKDIYILWFQGFNNAPDLVKKCLFSWKYHNPDWNIIELDDTNLDTYVDVSSYSQITLTALSDIVRILLLNKFGGIWVDATTFCDMPLNNWLPNNITEGFFTFSWPRKKCINHKISSYFIYSEKGGYIINELEKAIIQYFKDYQTPQEYFWLHRLFGLRYTLDPLFKNAHDKTPCIDAACGPHRFSAALNRGLTIKDKILIDSNTIPFYKLSYKVKITNERPDIIFKYIFERKTNTVVEKKEGILQETIEESSTLPPFINHIQVKKVKERICRFTHINNKNNCFT